MNDADSSKLIQFTQSLGVCWLSLAVICQLSMMHRLSSPTLIGLCVFHVLNSAIVLRHSESWVDAAFSISLGLITAVAYKREKSAASSLSIAKTD